MIRSFSKPPVVEIICQFRFSLGDENPWTNKKPGELIKALGNDYPNFEPANDVTVDIHIKEGGNITPELLAPKQRFIYSSDDNNRSITVAPDSFAFVYKVASENTYNSWQESYKPLLKDAWSKVCACLSIKELKSVGLRYINHINISSDFFIADALNLESSYLPAAVIKNHLGFFNRTEIASDDNNTLSITTGTAHKLETKDKVIIIDIDRVITENIVISADYLPESLDSIHQDIEDVFFSSISDKQKARME